MLTGSRGTTNLDGSNVSHSPVFNRLIVEGMAASGLRISASYESFSTSLIIADEVVDAGKIDSSRKR